HCPVADAGVDHPFSYGRPHTDGSACTRLLTPAATPPAIACRAGAALRARWRRRGRRGIGVGEDLERFGLVAVVVGDRVDDRLTGDEPAVAGSRDGGVPDEDRFAAVVGIHEAETLFGVPPGDVPVL